MSWYLEWMGSITGLIGAFLLATHTRFSGWGFIAFLVSNFAWIGFALLQGISSILLMQAGFTATSLLGIYRWRKTLNIRK
jgi:hypothetical protein